ncbi:MAG: hypothetical protein ACXVBW_10280 [Bdellovibrionota bacterium]
MAEPLRQPRVTPVSPVLEIPQTIPPHKIRRDPARDAYQILRFAFTVAPIVMGLDKFFGLLVNWDNYLAPVVPRVLGIAPHTFMQAAGVVEIIAGVGIAFKPKIFGYIVFAWLLGIVVNLVMTGQYFDIAVRDFGLALGALALARLSSRADVRVTPSI